MRVQNKYLKSFECKSEKVLDAPLSKKGFFIRLEQPLHDILESLPSTERTSLIRRAIASELKNQGLL